MVKWQKEPREHHRKKTWTSKQIVNEDSPESGWKRTLARLLKQISRWSIEGWLEGKAMSAEQHKSLHEARYHRVETQFLRRFWKRSNLHQCDNVTLVQSELLALIRPLWIGLRIIWTLSATTLLHSVAHGATKCSIVARSHRFTWKRVNGGCVLLNYRQCCNRLSSTISVRWENIPSIALHLSLSQYISSGSVKTIMRASTIYRMSSPEAAFSILYDVLCEVVEKV